jgi:hypothetical protein
MATVRGIAQRDVTAPHKSELITPKPLSQTIPLASPNRLNADPGAALSEAVRY